ncbi:Antiviral helicase ski2 [Dimargaris verticillata]|uniref:Antiviral helicase ski2 n=1 Tax=Dimargaris verticillata TaxID=2761393 RepID=A0A9W8BAH9_9FUNG|nr:Antiviral helicase ski2 [Dimargaris verticillata]
MTDQPPPLASDDNTASETATPLLFDIISADSLNQVPMAIPSACSPFDTNTNGQQTAWPFKTLFPAGIDPPFTPEDVADELEARFFTPSPIFPEHWLKHSQRTLTREVDYPALLTIPPGTPSTVLDITHDLATLEVTAHQERVEQDPLMTLQTATSLARLAVDKTAYIRGRSANVPLAPGGLGLSTETASQPFAESSAPNDELSLFGSDLLSIPPGFARGATFQARSTGTIGTLLRTGQSGQVTAPDKVTTRPHLLDSAPDVCPDQQESALPTTDVSEEAEVLADLKNDAYPQPPAADSQVSKQKWAHMVDCSGKFDNFVQLVPQLAHSYPFELDTFQKQAVYHLEQGDSVFVAAHTSAGKTVVAEYAIAMAMKHMTKTLYTSPIKALSNQKFRDFGQTFGMDNVGILTGDIQIQPEAPCLVMTTEILRSMLYRGADLIRDVEFVIFDEVHYLNDAERGVVWEEVIIMLPAHISLVLLSATIPNTQEFADWVGRTRKRNIYVVSTTYRPVPLEHFLYVNQKSYKVVDAQRKFLKNGWKEAHDALTSEVKKEKWQIKTKGKLSDNAPAAGKHSGRGDRGRGASGATGRGGGVIAGPSFHRRTNQPDTSLWVHLLGCLRKKALLPAVIFTFSRRRCEEYAHGLTNTDFNTAVQKHAVQLFITKSLVRLREPDRRLPQIVRMTDLLRRGIAVHHGGLLPILKEIVEILFARGLVRVLFATETFAMGVNMPTRTVVFSSVRKHDGHGMRDLLPGEYTQMSGRAGRRGLDSTGVVMIVCPSEVPDVTTLNTMLLGPSTRLQSQFRLTYTMILNLLRVESLKVEEVMKQSFSENISQQSLPERERLLHQTQARLKALAPQEECNRCGPSLTALHDTWVNVSDARHQMYRLLRAMPIASPIWVPGRVVVVNPPSHLPSLGVMLTSPRKSTAWTRDAGAQLSTSTTSNWQFACLMLARPQPTPIAPDYPSCFPFIPASMTNLDGALHPFAIGTSSSSPPQPQIQTLTLDSVCMTTRYILSAPLPAGGTQGTVNCSDMAVAELQALLVHPPQGWQEVDWSSKIKAFDVQVLYQQLQDVEPTMSHFDCLACPRLVLHYQRVNYQHQLEAMLQRLRHAMSDHNLYLLPDYEQRLDVLQTLQCIDMQGTVQLKGRVACEINTADELVLTELILENILADFAPPEIAAMLSCFIFQERCPSEPYLVPALERAKAELIATTRKVAAIQEACGIIDVREEEAVESTLRFGLMEVVYEWARGLTFNEITELTDVQEGTIVRTIVRLEDTCREVRAAARTIGDSQLYQKMEQVSALIKRDIVFTTSLYF